jgi:hypothetical protein
VPHSILDAIRSGHWSFEPTEMDAQAFDPCDAMPGTPDKVKTLAERVAQGLPLWHESDRDDLDTPVRKPR